jgi:acetyl-CoA C-acetyltransferase
MSNIFIVAAKRTPIGSFGGKLSGFTAVELGHIASISAIEASGLTADKINEVFYGNVCSANLGQAPARQVALGAGLPYSVPCTTVNKVCSSGLKAVMLAAQSIASGNQHILLAGGMESMSNIPYYIPKARWGYKYGHGEIVDGLQKDGLTDAYDKNAMGICADATASKFNISRESQDEYAINSYKKAALAASDGKFKSEIAPVSIPQKKGDPVIMGEDEEFRNVVFDKVPTLRPAFTKDGSVTASKCIYY